MRSTTAVIPETPVVLPLRKRPFRRRLPKANSRHFRKLAQPFARKLTALAGRYLLDYSSQNDRSRRSVHRHRKGVFDFIWFAEKTALVLKRQNLSAQVGRDYLDWMQSVREMKIFSVYENWRCLVDFSTWLVKTGQLRTHELTFVSGTVATPPSAIRIVQGPFRSRGFHLKPQNLRLARIAALVPKYIAYLRDELSLAPLTCRNCSYRLLAFLSYLQDVRNLNIGPENITRELGLDYLNWCRDAGGVGNRTRAQNSCSLRGFFKWMYKERIVLTHPMETLPVPRYDRGHPRPLLKDQIAALFSKPDLSTFLGRRDLAILELMYGSGLRIGEIPGLNLGTLQLSAEGGGPQITLVGKGGHTRAVPLTVQCVEALNAYLDFRGDGVLQDPLFTTMKGSRLRQGVLFHRIKKYRKLVPRGDEITGHRLRHSFASHLYANGAPIEAISRLLGHKDISTTEVYTEVTPLQVFKAYKAASFRENLPKVFGV